MGLEIIEYTRYSLICNDCGFAEDGYESEAAVERDYAMHKVEGDCVDD